MHLKNLKPFEVYKEEVLLTYHKKKDDDSLPANLKRHTPASIKKECVDEFPGRYSEKDNETFKALLGSAKNAEEYYQKIKIADPDIFRPLNNFLKGDTDNTHERNIHLLAWLIGFENKTVTTSPISLLDLFRRIIPWIHNTLDNKKTAYLIALIIITLTVMLSFLMKPRSMYWNGVVYKSIAFYQDVDSLIFIVPMDPVRLQHLRKIRNLRLITRNSIGVVHYSKINNAVEFYTTGGKCPEDTTKWLHPMTEYIYKKYVLKSVINN